MSVWINVTNIDFSCKFDQASYFFNLLVSPASIKWPTPDTEQSEGFLFLSFANHNVARSACSTICKTEFLGRKLSAVILSGEPNVTAENIKSFVGTDYDPIYPIEKELPPGDTFIIT